MIVGSGRLRCREYGFGRGGDTVLRFGRNGGFGDGRRRRGSRYGRGFRNRGNPRFIHRRNGYFHAVVRPGDGGGLRRFRYGNFDFYGFRSFSKDRRGRADFPVGRSERDGSLGIWESEIGFGARGNENRAFGKRSRFEVGTERPAGEGYGSGAVVLEHDGDVLRVVRDADAVFETEGDGRDDVVFAFDFGLVLLIDVGEVEEGSGFVDLEGLRVGERVARRSLGVERVPDFGGWVARGEAHRNGGVVGARGFAGGDGNRRSRPCRGYGRSERGKGAEYRSEEFCGSFHRDLIGCVPSFSP